MDISGITSATASASQLASSASNFVSSGPASGLSSVSNALGAVGGFLSSLAGAGLKTPMPNVLSDYASYNYVLSISALTIKDFNFPDTSYKAGKVLPIICKSAGADPNNRIATAYGKHDFFINNLSFDTIIGMTTPKATNVTTIQFDVVEPYSIGIFLLSLQTAAYAAGHQNWRDAPFLLTIEFRGNKETGQMVNIPATRHIPIRLTTVNMRASEQGAVYSCSAYATQGQALTTQYANLRTDTTIKGKTVQEVLQTGEYSLQSVVNKKLQELVKDKTVSVADQVVILFPKEIASAAVAGGSSSGESAKTATVSTAAASSSSSLFTKLGVTQSNINQTLVQPTGEVNELGAASMGYSLSKKGDAPTKQEQKVYDDKKEMWTRGKITIDPTEGAMRFSQDTDIPSVINTVLLSSSYPETALEANNIDTNGMRTWWRIDTQVYYIDSNENLDKTGTLPRVIVYRVIPYGVHTSKTTAPNVQAPGIENLMKKVAKRYDYIYTGKNSEIIKFNIDFSVGFSNVMAADNYKNSQDVDNAKNNSPDVEKEKKIQQIDQGAKPGNTPGGTASQVNYSGTGTSFDGKGGGGQDTPATRAAKVFHDAITNPNDMVVLDLEIWGDPFWIAQSGMGNYTSSPVKANKDVNADGTVNWQSSEVDILVLFRSPLDINQTTGMYDFGTSTKASPVISFNGLYCVNRVSNSFRDGEFRQTLSGYRRPLQDSKTKATPQQTMNVSTPTKK